MAGYLEQTVKTTHCEDRTLIHENIPLPSSKPYVIYCVKRQTLRKQGIGGVSCFLLSDWGWI